MSTILAVDPGVRGCGVALFVHSLTGERLRRAAYVRNPHKTGDGMGEVESMARAVRDSFDRMACVTFDRLVLEFPQVYTGARAKGDPRDLLALAAVDGAICGFVHHTEAVRVLPREWKGQVDPDVLIERVKARLLPAEIAAVELPCASLAHNVWDAVGLGLFSVGRFHAHHVIAR